MKDYKMTHFFHRNDGVLEYLAKRDHTEYMVPSSFIWIPQCSSPMVRRLRLAHRRDALISRQALFERSELAGPPQIGVRPLP